MMWDLIRADAYVSDFIMKDSTQEPKDRKCYSL